MNLIKEFHVHLKDLYFLFLFQDLKDNQLFSLIP